MDVQEFLDKYGACLLGREYASQYKTLQEAWDNCDKPAWLLWGLSKFKPLTKDQSVKLVNLFREQVKLETGSVYASYVYDSVYNVSRDLAAADIVSDTVYAAVAGVNLFTARNSKDEYTARKEMRIKICNIIRENIHPFE